MIEGLKNQPIIQIEQNPVFALHSRRNGLEALVQHNMLKFSRRNFFDEESAIIDFVTEQEQIHRVIVDINSQLAGFTKKDVFKLAVNDISRRISWVKNRVSERTPMYKIGNAK